MSVCPCKWHELSHYWTAFLPFPPDQKWYSSWLTQYTLQYFNASAGSLELPIRKIAMTVQPHDTTTQHKQRVRCVKGFKVSVVVILYTATKKGLWRFVHTTLFLRFRCVKSTSVRVCFNSAATVFNTVFNPQIHHKGVLESLDDGTLFMTMWWPLFLSPYEALLWHYFKLSPAFHSWPMMWWDPSQRAKIESSFFE